MLILFAAVSIAFLAGSLASAQTTNAPSQIGPGTTGTVGAQKAAPAAGKPKKMLDSALTPQTRQTLEDAMNSPAPASGPAPSKPAPPQEVTIGPGEAAKVSGNGAQKVPYKSLPPPVKNALNGDAKQNLGGSQPH